METSLIKEHRADLVQGIRQGKEASASCIDNPASRMGLPNNCESGADLAERIALIFETEATMDYYAGFARKPQAVGEVIRSLLAIIKQQRGALERSRKYWQHNEWASFSVGVGDDDKSRILEALAASEKLKQFLGE